MFDKPTIFCFFFPKKAFFRKTASISHRFDTKFVNITKINFFAILFSYFLHGFASSVRYSIRAIS